MSDEEVEESLRQDASSRKRKTSWLKELMTEVEESVDLPRGRLGRAGHLRDFPAIWHM